MTWISLVKSDTREVLPISAYIQKGEENIIRDCYENRECKEFTERDGIFVKL
jgi:hypothetical protein